MSKELRYNQRQGFTIGEIKTIEAVCGVSTVTGIWTEELVGKVREWQEDRGIKPDGKVWRSSKGNTWPALLSVFEGESPSLGLDEEPSTRLQSAVASEFVKSLGFRQNKYGPRRSYSAVVIHTTGAGPIKRWQREKGTSRAQPTPFDTAVRRTYHQIMVYGPHYVVGQDTGQCIQVCPEQLAAWHVGSKYSKRYRSGDWMRQRYDWWSQRFDESTSPYDLADGMLWHSGSCNMNTIGIEVVPPTDDLRAPWSDTCKDRLTLLVSDICDRRGIPRDREHILSHSECNPMARTTDRGDPWDPCVEQWENWNTLK